MNNLATITLALLATSAVAPAQITLLEDHRHIELSANGELGDDVCSQLDQQQPSIPFGGRSLNRSLFCTRPSVYQSSAFAGLSSNLSNVGLRAFGHSQVFATAGQGASASGFATAHFIIDFSLDSPVSFRLSGIASIQDAELHVTVADHDGLPVLAFDADQPETIVHRLGLLPAGQYRFEVEGESSALAVTPDVQATAGISYNIRLEVSHGPACIADHNFDGEINPDDFASFVSDFFFAEVRDGLVDADENGVADADDLSDFITAYFSGC